MYCPQCFQNTLKMRSNGVIKLAFNGKSRSTSLFTYNLQKESHEQLLAKLKERMVDFLSFYSEFNNKTPIKTFEAFSSDFQCTSGCKNDPNSKFSVIGLVFTNDEAKNLLEQEGKNFGVEIKLSTT
jgi:uncharacterized protein with ParB-like and HNH nuclease domain